MSTKKILLPESSVKERTRVRRARPEESGEKERRQSQGRSGNRSPRTMPMVTDIRQRNEAVGLVLVGVSAFSLSLIHYISSSKIPGLINASMIYLGVGVYILPILVGLMGVQRFMERPFQNLGWRLAGCCGVMTFGLGLLGLEGGKLGVHTFELFSGTFGPVPSKILFVSLVLSSMIFALDILYKDLLATTLVIASLLTRLAFFIWEVTLALLSMLIGAVKTTGDLVAAVAGRIKQTWQEQEIDPEGKLGKLLSFRPRMPVTEEFCEELAGETPVAFDDNEEEATIIPVPQCWQDNPEKNNPSPTPVPPVGVAAPNGVCVQVSTITTECVFGSNHGISSIDATEKTAEAAESSEELRVLVNFEDDEDDSEDDDDDCVDEETLNDDKERKIAGAPDAVNSKTGVQGVSRETKIEDEPVYLDDNRIDHELKNDIHDKPIARVNRHADAQLPPLSLLKVPPPRDISAVKSDLTERSALLLKTLDEFGIKASIMDIVEGPAISRFELKPAPGVKVSRITTLAEDIALAMGGLQLRIEAPIPGKPALGIEIPNPKPTPVYFYDLIKNDKFKTNPVPLNLALGVTINGQPVFADLSDMPHLLIAGSTGSGKSVCVNTIIASILFQARADQVKFVMIDPKMVELSSYNGIPHLIAPVVTEPERAAAALAWAVEEMNRRYEILASCGCKKITTYNEEIERLRQDIDPELEPMPFIVIIIDELADLMMTASVEVETSICRLAQMARAVGMHLIIATQRPSVNVLTGLIKANLPTRIAFSVACAVDSRTILDAKGAESLLGKGDMLFIPKGRNKPLRLQGAFVSDRELMELIEFVKGQGQPEYLDIAPARSDSDDDEDDGDESDDSKSGNADSSLTERIVNYLETQEKTSTSMLQRKFSIGYNRAARIMDQLEEKGLVSPMDGSNKRRVLIGRSSTQV
ncbi:MAG TPA: DNA translocase FtsK [Candidatus Rifleibacterium sp.]|nr:DNA translocase FtsK [Candidatus Rifleibacterium sp.]HPT45311.1 DNA translocase FtsK [Candidatus Rifleibacterium sp.]